MSQPPPDNLPPLRKPPWLKVPLPGGANYARIEGYHRRQGLNSVCRSASCPNQGECWNSGTATFMILGDRCSRSCRFCNIEQASPLPVDQDENSKIAQAIAELELRHAVITSVTRDDLPDGGASRFADLVMQIRHQTDCRIELLIPDLQGNSAALQVILTACPDILGHNMETVPRLYARIRPEARYERSLNLLNQIKKQAPAIISKSGLMLGLGEEPGEVLAVMEDLRAARCDVLTLGQYLPPSRNHARVERYLHPDEFAQLAAQGRQLGFRHVEAGPLVRSSFHAADQISAR